MEIEAISRSQQKDILTEPLNVSFNIIELVPTSSPHTGDGG